MGHKADNKFFERKRPWSVRKDNILSRYLVPYLAKIKTLKRPILIVDGFAGPGKFGDGNPGSPLLICEIVQNAILNSETQIEVRCIEADNDLFHQLESNLHYSFVTPKCGAFEDHVQEIVDATQTHNCFIYLDPYTCSSIQWDAISRFAKGISSGTSVEILFNFNTPSFARWARATRRQETEVTHSGEDDCEFIDSATENQSTVKLDTIVGGSWWNALLEHRSFSQLNHELASEIGIRLRQLFGEMCWVGVNKKFRASIPVYHMFFGSRHPDGLELMNDAMVKATGTDLFVDFFAEDELEKLILDRAEVWIERGELILQVIREAFCRFRRADIRGHIETFLKSKQLVSETGKIKINDQVRVKRNELS